MDDIYYVYEHWRLDRDECFYVGKGSGLRAYQMTKRNPHHQAILSKLSMEGSAAEVRIVACGLSEEAAYDLEIERIAFWREANVDLTNICVGGVGSKGFQHTEEFKQRVSKWAKGNKFGLGVKKTPEQIEQIRQRSLGNTNTLGRKLSDEHRKKISESSKGRVVSEEVRRNMSKGQTGRKFSEESRRKMSEAKKAAHAAKLARLAEVESK